MVGLVAKCSTEWLIDWLLLLLVVVVVCEWMIGHARLSEWLSEWLNESEWLSESE